MDYDNRESIDEYNYSDTLAFICFKLIIVILIIRRGKVRQTGPLQCMCLRQKNLALL